MIVLQFKCTLLSDVILNMKSASSGANKTLDFIPGNCFLGIAASKLYAKSDDKVGYDESWQIFHSGKVRFGDAHPALNDQRALRVPASMFYPKMKRASESCYIFHYYDRSKDKLDNGGAQQLKQCRNGFYVFNPDTHSGKRINSLKSFAIKSSYDIDRRCSEDEKLFGYESMRKGQVFLFEIEVEDPAEKYIDALVESMTQGNKRVGRSRTAQYGLVKIELISSAPKTDVPRHVKADCVITVYADGRLIFIDENTGLPTFHPTAGQLGLDDGWEIDWSKSQIRTFQYAPWNFMRQAFDSDRCGIEKGSVFVLKCRSGVLPQQSAYVGSYRNEGFGKVIYNPAFLDVDSNPDGNGQSLYKLEEVDDFNSHNQLSGSDLSGTPLLCYLSGKKKHKEDINKIYGFVADFINKNNSRFSGDAFASQWGSVRSIAQCCTSVNELRDRLIGNADAYLNHGVARDKWETRGRKVTLESFITDVEDSVNDKKMVLWAVINLASEMAKKCRKETR